MKKFVRYSKNGIVNIDNIANVNDGGKDHTWFYVVGSPVSIHVDKDYVESFMLALESYM